MEAQHQHILDAGYSKVDLDAMVDELEISPGSRRKLKQTLNKFPTLFGGGLGLLDIQLVSIELQKDAKPFNGRDTTLHQKLLKLHSRKKSTKCVKHRS